MQSPSVGHVTPLIWTNRRAVAAAGLVAGWLLSVEVGTSRTASRAAQRDEADDLIVDKTTGQLCDLAFATAIVGGIYASRRAKQATIRSRRLSFVVGLAMQGVGGVLSTIARQHLGRFHRAALTVHADHELVETGPYRLIRHPLYTATIAVFLGIGATLGNWLSVLLSGLPAAALVYRITVEEDMLEDAFGVSYDLYRGSTDRLIPRVW